MPEVYFSTFDEPIYRLGSKTIRKGSWVYLFKENFLATQLAIKATNINSHQRRILRCEQTHMSNKMLRCGLDSFIKISNNINYRLSKVVRIRGGHLNIRRLDSKYLTLILSLRDCQPELLIGCTEAITDSAMSDRYRGMWSRKKPCK